MELSPRLLCLRGHYHQHESVWDIGCDHGKLGLSFLNEEGVRAIHLVDPSLPVVEKLKHSIDSYITDPFLKIHIHHQNGQDILPGPEKKLVLIAGMGGKEIISICESLISKLSPQDDLVISPHRDLLSVREQLHASPFSLVKESLIFDDGRYYQVISLSLRPGPGSIFTGRLFSQVKEGNPIEFISLGLSVPIRMCGPDNIPIISVA